jgi:hypothetical protein
MTSPAREHSLARSIVAVVIATTRFASAQPTQELTREFQAGVDAFRLGHFDEARTHLENARTIDPKLPGPHRFLAAVAQAQGRWQDCIDSARKALEVNPQSQEVTDTRKVHDECRTSGGRAPFRGELGDSAAIAVTSNVSGATVKIGGLTYGATPLAPRPITAGSLDIEVEKAGWKPGHATLTAPSGIVTDLAIDLEPDPNAKTDVDLGVQTAAKPTVGWLELDQATCARVGIPCTTLSIDGKAVTLTAGAKPGPAELTPGEHVVEVPSQPRFDPWRRSIKIVAGQKIVLAPDLVETAPREHKERIGFGFLAGGGALAGFGFAAALLSQHAAADAREIIRVETKRDPTKPLASTAAVEPLRTRADLEDARSRASRWALISNVTYGAALVSAVVGAYYLYRGAKTEVAPPLQINPVTGGAVVSKEIAW